MEALIPNIASRGASWNVCVRQTSGRAEMRLGRINSSTRGCETGPRRISGVRCTTLKQKERAHRSGLPSRQGPNPSHVQHTSQGTEVCTV